jgi:hypothetical protein
VTIFNSTVENCVEKAVKQFKNADQHEAYPVCTKLVQLSQFFLLWTFLPNSGWRKSG